MQENFLPSKLLVSKSSKVYRVFRHVPLANPCQLKWGEGIWIRPFQYLCHLFFSKNVLEDQLLLQTQIINKIFVNQIFLTRRKLFHCMPSCNQILGLKSQTFSKSLKYVETRGFFSYILARSAQKSCRIIIKAQLLGNQKIAKGPDDLASCLGSTRYWQLKFSEFAWIRISWNLSKFEFIQTTFIFIFLKAMLRLCMVFWGFSKVHPLKIWK